MFIGRERELTALQNQYNSSKFEFTVIYGRRRVGKTAIINEFVKDKDVIYFTGVESNEKQNLENFSQSIMSYKSDLPQGSEFTSFQDALEFVFKLAQEKRIVLVIDEYPYVAKASKSLASTLQLMIDKHKDASKLFLILCGSSMSYMEDHVLAYKAPLYGRRTAQLKVQPFEFMEACKHFPKFAAEDKAIAYGIVGGTPQYLLQLDDGLSIKENIKKKFQDHKLPLVDEVIELDAKARAAQSEADELRASRNKLSKQIGALMGQGKKDEAEEVKAQVAANAARLSELEAQEKELSEKVTKIMMTIPNIIDPSVPIGKDDSCNVEIEKFGDPYVPDFEIPYHTDIMERFDGIDLDAAGKVAGNGFYYLMGDIARIHSSVIAYARDFMINRGFTYCVPPFMIRSNVVTGVMSFDEMDAMMYKIEGEDLYLIGTSEHSMIGKFIDTINDEEKLPYTLTSYSPCFRKEKGAHGIEERGVYRIHQFEKQEMIVVCKPEESKAWYDKLWKNTVDLFRSLDIPVRTLECCSGDLADLKVKSCDVEAWSPRQKKYFEVGSCSNLGDAQARRLKIRIKGKDGRKYFAHTLNNTVVAPPRMLIAFLENNLNEDGSVNIPKALQPYMGGIEKIVPKHE